MKKYQYYKLYILSFIFIFLVTFCSKENYDRSIIVLEIPSNLKDINTKYDDYNAIPLYPSDLTYLFFSTNSESEGDNFDITPRGLNFYYDTNNYNLEVTTANSYPFGTYEILPLVNTSKDEFGPYFYESGYDLFFMYATDIQGNFDIMVVEAKGNDYGTEYEVDGPYGIAIINEYSDDLYPSFSVENNILCFCSNYNDMVFNIYNAKYKSEITTELLISGDQVEIEKDTIISSIANDKCPYVRDSIIVFVSDRNGGYGGYDLYYSIYKDKSWSNPINFGNKINTAYNEYRPVIFKIMEYNTEFPNFFIMIFSSDRPSGKGGYDLYIVNISNSFISCKN